MAHGGFLDAVNQREHRQWLCIPHVLPPVNFERCWNVSNSSNKGSNLSALDAASVFSQPQELQLSLVAICEHQTERWQYRAAGLQPRTSNNHRAAETGEVSTRAETPVITFRELPVCSKEDNATQHVASTCTVTQTQLAHDSYQGEKRKHS